MCWEDARTDKGTGIVRFSPSQLRKVASNERWAEIYLAPNPRFQSRYSSSEISPESRLARIAAHALTAASSFWAPGAAGSTATPGATRVRLGPRAESLLEPEQDLDRVARRLDPVVGERGGGDPERPREGLQVLRPGRPEPELVVAHRGLGHARHLGELALQEAAPRPELAYPAAVRHVSPVSLVYVVYQIISG